MLLEERADRGRVGLARRGVRCAGAAEVEEAVERAHEECWQRDPDEVGRRAVVEVELRRHAAGLSGLEIGIVRVPAPVREPNVGAHRPVPEMRGAGQARRVGGRGERRRAQRAFGVGGAEPRMVAADPLDGVDRLPCELVGGHRPSSCSRSPT